MRLALTEQEETQDQMEQVLEEKINLIQELSSGEDFWKIKRKNMKRNRTLWKECGFYRFGRGLAPRGA